VSGLHEKMVAGQAQQIAHLAVEIARKILRSRVDENDYKMEAIIEEALKQAPIKHGVTVRLHPDDMARCKAVQEQDGNGVLGAAEFVIETAKGSVESFIDDHLTRVEEAIKTCWQTN
jgi:flagellar biosynthesis/type III secretory pathway protein FliH